MFCNALEFDQSLTSFDMSKINNDIMCNKILFVFSVQWLPTPVEQIRLFKRHARLCTRSLTIQVCLAAASERQFVVS